MIPDRRVCKVAIAGMPDDLNASSILGPIGNTIILATLDVSD